ncbi:hypothetical protein K2D_14350 [Planctomycetes bacterium K2D]|uniref:Uncharacterized protein n=1 Tax=Botrimarina mediterranea TaxID=2528022 RepID=A0A518K692_9BACT|nr:hypothetical protein Spa11_15090 [Botrimarina mediterranea]QDV77830.1 hypothetical protein K2D_14350 [Planctomycetes bacterium K2D]
MQLISVLWVRQLHETFTEFFPLIRPRIDTVHQDLAAFSDYPDLFESPSAVICEHLWLNP